MAWGLEKAKRRYAAQAKPAPASTVRRGRGPSAGRARQPSVAPRATPTPIAGVPRQEAVRVRAAAPKSKAKTRQKPKRSKATEVAVDAAAWNALLKRQGIGAKTSYNLYANPGAVEQANYEGYMRRRLWPAMRRELNLPKSTPMPKFDYGDLQDHAAHVDMRPESGRRKVTFGIETAMQADLRPARDRKRTKSSTYARRVPLHEWAHVYQSDMSKRRLRELLKTGGEEFETYLAGLRRLREGGAEAHSRQLARKIGVGVGYKGYPNAARYVARERGQRYIRKGQFR